MAELEPFFVPENFQDFDVPSSGWYAIGLGGKILRELGCHSSIVGIERAIQDAGHSLPPGHFRAHD
jgi:hypothetical protein